jgi:hypothetical protein
MTKLGKKIGRNMRPELFKIHHASARHYKGNEITLNSTQGGCYV